MRSDYTVVLQRIEKQVKSWGLPYVSRLAEKRRNPFRILISCILSLRTKDKVTAAASQRLFRVAETPEKLAALKVSCIERIIYPVGFYRNKARVIKEVAQRIVAEYHGKVPSDEAALLSFRGVGRKTVNLVLGLGFGHPAICVDTHVHRISNRLGCVNTASPYRTEEELKKIISRRYWIKLNTLLVSFGQNICLPISPRCSQCSVFKYCARRGVERSR